MRVIVWLGVVITAKRNGRLLHIYIYLCEVLTTVFRLPIIHNVDLAKIYGYLFRFPLSLSTSFKGGNDDLVGVSSSRCFFPVAFFVESPSYYQLEVKTERL